LLNFAPQYKQIMNFRFLYQRLTYIIINPERAWTIIKSENRPVGEVRSSYFFPLITLIAISGFLGSLFFTHTDLNIAYPILQGIKYFILLYIAINLSTVILSEICHALDLERNFSTSFKLINYSLAPFLVTQIISRIFESLIFVNILSIYGLYIFWLGVEKMLDPPDHKKLPLVIATTITLIIIYVVLDKLLRELTGSVYFNIFA